MDNREHDLLSRTLHGIADTGLPGPELGSQLAERALRGAVRRRTARIAAASVAVTATAAVTLIAATTPLHGPSNTVSPQAAKSSKPSALPPTKELPANTAEQAAIVRACMVGDPSIPEQHLTPPSIGPNGRVTPFRDGNMTGRGTHVADFRFLAATPPDSKGGRLVLLGSTVAYRTCTLDAHGTPSSDDRIPHQTANVWNTAVPFGGFPNDVIFDVGGGGQLGEKGWTLDEFVRAGWVDYVGGRTAPGVAKITLSTGTGPTLEAAVTNNFFVARHFGTGLFPESGAPVPGIVKLYDASGHLLKTMQWKLDRNLFR